MEEPGGHHLPRNSREPGVRRTAGLHGRTEIGKILMITQALGTGTHSDQAAGVAGAAYTTGLAGIWYQWT